MSAMARTRSGHLTSEQYAYFLFFKFSFHPTLSLRLPLSTQGCNVESTMKPRKLSPADSDALIRMAWHDRTSFDEIRERTGLSESDVIRHMRAQLKPTSFRLWRKRVSGRITKHRKPFKQRNT